MCWIISGKQPQTLQSAISHSLGHLIFVAGDHLKRNLFKWESGILAHPVDGRNPAPVGRYIIPLFAGFCTCQVVVWDFFHQPYEGIMLVKILLLEGIWGGTPRFPWWKCLQKPKSRPPSLHVQETFIDLEIPTRFKWFQYNMIEWWIPY